MAKLLQFIRKLCLQVNKFVYARARKCEREMVSYEIFEFKILKITPYVILKKTFFFLNWSVIEVFEITISE